MKSIKLNFSQDKTFIFYDFDFFSLFDLISSFSNNYKTLKNFKKVENLSQHFYRLNKFKIFQLYLKSYKKHLVNKYSDDFNMYKFQENNFQRNDKKQKIVRYNFPDILILIDFHLVDNLIFDDDINLECHPEYKNENGLKRIDESLINCVIDLSGYVNTRHGQNISIVPLICTENEKNLKSVGVLYELFSYLSLTKDSLVVSIGGGTMSDICGFAASTYLRGINFAIVPSTLLSMIDASVGGKNGVNFKNHKNIIGSFYFPRFITIIPELISFLDSIELLSGFAEYLKYLFISNNYKKVKNLIKNFESYKEKSKNSPQRSSDNLSRLCNFLVVYFNHNPDNILDAIKFKYRIVKGDERDSDKRHILNFGHTIGHAIEKNLSLPHGLSVLIGMLWETRISYLSGLVNLNYYLNFLTALKTLGLPTSLNDLFQFPQICLNDFKRLISNKKKDILLSLKYDKKIEQNSLVLFLPQKRKGKHYRFAKVRIDIMRFIDYLDDFLQVEINENEQEEKDI